MENSFNKKYFTAYSKYSKYPKTDSGLKKSATGLLKVYREDGILKVKDKATKDEESESLLQEIFVDGKLMVDEDILTIRKRIDEQIINILG